MALQVLSKRSELLSETRVPYLADEERAQVAELLARLEAECEADVQRVILYGSKARGDYDAESDVDLLIVSSGDAEGIESVVKELQKDIDFRFYPVIYTKQDHEYNKWLLPPFYVNVRRDGIELWDESERLLEELETPLDFQEGTFRQLDQSTCEVIRIYVERAKQDWAIANLLHSKGMLAGAVHSAYDACFRITIAALYCVNVVRGKHKAIPDAIRKFLVEPGFIEAEYLTMYLSLMRGGDFMEESGERGFALQLERMRLSDKARAMMLGDAKKFYARMERFLLERGAKID